MKQVNFSISQKVYQTLRFAVAMCFIGHGVFGIITKPIWCNYFGIFGIDHQLAYQLMPVIGIIDIFLGLLVLTYPVRLIPAWLVVWGLFTAFLRPLSGEPFAEFIERAGNYSAPLALLFLTGIPRNPKRWTERLSAPEFLPLRRRNELYTCLQIAAFLLFVGHGWLNLIMKRSLLSQYASVGFTEPATVAFVVGIIEIAMAFMVLVKPFRELVLFLFIWKVLSETLYASYPLFEWIERGGSYGVILALYFLTQRRFSVRIPLLKRSSV